MGFLGTAGERAGMISQWAGFGAGICLWRRDLSLIMSNLGCPLDIKVEMSRAIGNEWSWRRESGMDM